MAKVGDAVAYSTRFLKTIAEPPTSPTWQRRGQVVEVGPRLIKVLFDSDAEPIWVRPSNLCLVDPPKVSRSARAAMGYGSSLDLADMVSCQYGYVYGFNIDRASRESLRIAHEVLTNPTCQGVA